MEKKYQIFISSTYEDLKEERGKVQDTILSMCQFPIGMEMFSAGNEEQWEVIQETIDSSDYYILIIGHRYGSVIEKGKYAGISYTQKEFQYALSKKIPILAFLIHDKVSITPDRMEDDLVKKKKLEGFKSLVKKGRMVEWWTSAEDLAGKVSVALTKQISRGKRPGWIRTDAIDFAGTQKELVEMSKRIRELREENNELKKNVRTRKPKFWVEINDGKEIRIPYQDIDLSQAKEFYLDMLVKEEEQYINNILNPELADTSMFEPDEEGFKEYQKRYERRESIKKNKISFRISCKNIGTGKANDVNIEIKMPNDIIILAQNSNKRKANENNPLFDHANISDSQITTVYSPYEQMSQEDIQDNSLLICIKGLMHTRTYKSGEYEIAATKRGIYEIVGSVICEELETEEICYFKVIVE